MQKNIRESYKGWVHSILFFVILYLCGWFITTYDIISEDEHYELFRWNHIAKCYGIYYGGESLSKNEKLIFDINKPINEANRKCDNLVWEKRGDCIITSLDSVEYEMDKCINDFAEKNARDDIKKFNWNYDY